MIKLIRFIGLTLIVILICLLTCCNSAKRNSIPAETDNIKINSELKSELKAGFSVIPITPEIPDRWTDVNNDAEYNPKDGDTYTDGNGNGIFDPVWIAGFGNRRAANGIHDDLWARTMVIDDGRTRLAIVSLDVIGFMNNCVNDVRNIISQEAGITYLIITSTHSHEGPDLLGLWGKSFTKSGVNKEYLAYVKLQVAKSVEAAVKNLRPVYLTLSEDLTGGIPLVTDTRKPDVFDSGLRIIRAVDIKEGTTLGTFSTWGNHPETLWGKNLMITSDFPHYFREGVEKGISNGDSLVLPGTGGIAVYLSGAIGGLMTTSPEVGIKDPFTGEEFKKPTFDKAQALGRQLAIVALNSMLNPVERIDSASISLVARSVKLSLDNRLFKIGKILGVLDRGKTGIKSLWTEVAVFRIGPLSFVTFPGEVYPEIVNGGVMAPEGNDFSADPVEVPSVREMMPGKFNFVLGLANDEIGYIIPKSEWDKKAPFTFGRKSAPYGEENSVGPETAPLLHMNIKEMLLELK